MTSSRESPRSPERVSHTVDKAINANFSRIMAQTMALSTMQETRIQIATEKQERDLIHRHNTKRKTVLVEQRDLIQKAQKQGLIQALILGRRGIPA